MQILFYDVATPVAYTPETLQERGLGGTEATIIRIAHSLKNYHQIYIAQHCRATKENGIYDDVEYISLETANQLQPDVVILLREYQWIKPIGELFPHAKYYFWIHNFPPKDFYITLKDLIKYECEIIAVSHFHKQIIINRLKTPWYKLFFSDVKPFSRISVIYNPINDALMPDKTEFNRNQMLFMSSPHKGLAQSLSHFVKLEKQFPELQLLICNPGNWDASISIPKNAFVLGKIPHHQVIEHLRRSLCVFYPQTKRAETFGLVYAEANAVGTPVLAHDVGAAKEVLSDTKQLVNGNNFKEIAAKIAEWREQRPLIKAKEEFRLKNITKEWLDLLNNR